MTSLETSKRKLLISHSYQHDFKCYFSKVDGCETKVYNTKTGYLVGDCAHICAKNKGGERHDPKMSKGEIDSTSNLMLLCRKHHDEIDKTSPSKWTVTKLKEAKEKYEFQNEAMDWDSFHQTYSQCLDETLEYLQTMHKFELIDNRTCYPAEWKNSKFEKSKEQESKNKVYTVKNLIPSDLSKHPFKMPLAIVAGMGTGKSTFLLQLLEHIRSSEKFKPFPIFADFVSWEEKFSKINDPIEQFVAFVHSSFMKKMKSGDSRRALLTNKPAFCKHLKIHLQKFQTYILLDGLDEFPGDKDEIMDMVEMLDTRHVVILSGRDYTIGLSKPFSGGHLKRLKVLKLDCLTDMQISVYLENMKNKGKPTISLKTLQYLAPDEDEDALSYRNPLVLQAIIQQGLDKKLKPKEKFTHYKILELIVLATLEHSFYTKLGGKNLPNFDEQKLYGFKIKGLKNVFFKFNNKLAERFVAQKEKKSISEDKLREIIINEFTSYSAFFNRSFFDDINVNHLRLFGEEFRFVPDRMFDFFLVSNLKGLLNDEKKDRSSCIIQQLMKSTSKFSNTIRLLFDEYSKLPEHAKLLLAKIQHSFVEQVIEKRIKEQNSLVNKQKKNITSLYLNNIMLFSLPESLSSFKNFQELDLRNNKLSSLPASISLLQKLRVLSLGDNALSSLPASISLLQKLQRLSLSYNQLSSSPSEYFFTPGAPCVKLKW